MNTKSIVNGVYGGLAGGLVFGMIMAMMGMLPMIGKMIGHTQAQTTARYAHLADDPLRRAVEQVGGTIAAAMTGASAEIVSALDEGPCVLLVALEAVAQTVNDDERGFVRPAVCHPGTERETPGI